MNMGKQPRFQESAQEFPIKAVCQLWGLQRIRGREAPGVIGRSVAYGNEASTSAIKRIHRTQGKVIVETETGSYYELGVPNLGFAMSHPELMKELGFN